MKYEIKKDRDFNNQLIISVFSSDDEFQEWKNKYQIRDKKETIPFFIVDIANRLIIKNELEVYGNIKLKKIINREDLINFEVRVSLLPHVKLCDWKEIIEKRKEEKIIMSPSTGQVY